LTQTSVVLAPHPYVVATLPCEMQKSQFGRWQQWIHTG